IFPDKYPELVAESSEEWTFTLGWPRHILEPVDPLLVERAHSYFGAKLSDLDRFQVTEWHGGVPFVFSMFHSWAILAPALAIRNKQASPRVIVHVDAHHDLAPSLMGAVTQGALENQAFGVECRLDTPVSI